jgi:tetratricopeptide (TPR) repeat protein
MLRLAGRRRHVAPGAAAGNPLVCLDENTLVAFFERRLGPDEHARAERHMDRCSGCRQLVATVAQCGPGDDVGLVAVASPPDSAPELGAAGGHVGRYEITGRLGAGAMGVVYAARDPQLGRSVALKVLRSDRHRPDQAQARLVREAQAMARVSHPNVLAVHDVGIEAGQAFVVMELVLGQTVRAWLDAAPRPRGEVLAVFLAAGRGLAAAHEAGLVHRDFKPENVLLGSSDRVMVADFGLTRGALEVEPGSGDSSLEWRDDSCLTAAGTLLGTPAYMAPELYDGPPADARSDQYSFCVALYEALVGLRPRRPASSGERAALLWPRPIPPRSSVPGWLRRVLGRGLSASPRDRFGSMKSLLAELERGPRRGRWALAAGAATVAVLLASTATHGLSARSSADGAPHPRGATAPAPTAMTDLPSPSSSEPRALAAFRSAMQSLRGASNMLAIDGLRRATALDPSMAAAELRLIYFASASPEPEEGRKHYKAALDGREALTERDRVLLDTFEPLVRDPPDVATRRQRLEAAASRYPGDAEIAFYLGDARSDAGDRAAALEAFDDALRIDPAFALPLWAKAGVLDNTGDRDRALQALDQCIAVAPSAASCLRVRAAFNGRRGACALSTQDAKRTLEVEPGSYRAYDVLARSLSAELDTAAVEQALEEKWALVPSGERGRAHLEDRIDLELLRGDFAQAEIESRRLLADLAQEPAERPHGRAVHRLLDIYEETGQSGLAASIAGDFLRRRGAFSRRLGDPFDVQTDVVPLAISTLLRAGQITRTEALAQRDAWVRDQNSRLTPNDRRFVWFSGYAATVRTVEEAEAATEARGAFGPIPDGEEDNASSAATGRTLFLSGDAAGALPLLRRGAAACHVLVTPVALVRAQLWLGEAEEATGDRAAACRAYSVVLHRWGAARPASRTLQRAQGRASALGCGD